MSSASATGEPSGDRPKGEGTAKAAPPGVREHEMQDAAVALLTVVLSLLLGFIVAQILGISRAHNPQIAIPADEIGVFVCVVSLIAIPAFLRKKSLRTLLIFSGVIFFVSGILLALTV